MAISTFPAASAASKTRYVVTLLSGTSWTVPAGCLYVNAKLFGGGGGSYARDFGASGSVVETNLATTPGASITYAIGAGGNGSASSPASGGTTSFTGATSAVGGASGSIGAVGATGSGADNAGAPGATGGNGGPGKIELEYWA